MTASPIEEEQIRDALRCVVDPELGLNIVDLGFIYDIRIAKDKVAIKMTLTTPGCPMHGSLVEGVQMALLRLPGVEEAEVELVWDPPWHPSMMSEQARAQLGVR